MAIKNVKGVIIIASFVGCHCLTVQRNK